MFKEVKVFHKGIRPTNALDALCSRLKSLGLKPSLIFNYEYLPLSSTVDEDTFLYIFLGGWDADPENELKQRLAQLLGSEFEIHERLLGSLKGDYPEGYAVVPRGAEVFDMALYYEKGESGYLVIPDSTLKLQTVFDAGLEKKLMHCFSKFHRRYEKEYWFDKEQDVQALKLQFPNLEFSQEKIGKLYLCTASFKSPSHKSPAEFFYVLDSFVIGALPIDGDLATSVVKLLKKKNYSIAFAESCSGGALAKALTEIPGASEVFNGSFVCYSNEMKEKLLNVPGLMIEEYGVVSAEVSKAMCKGLKCLDADFNVAVTGIAGPTGGTTQRPIGTVWVTLNGPNEFSKTWNVEACGSRGEIVFQTVQSVLTELLKFISLI